MSVLHETAKVTGLDGQTIRLETSRKAACSGCSLKSGCGQYLLARGNDCLVLRGDALSESGPGTLKQGATIRLSLQPVQLLKLTALFYLLPLLLLIAATLLATLTGLGEGNTILLALLGLLSGFLASRLILKSRAVGRSLSPRIEEVTLACEN